MKVSAIVYTSNTGFTAQYATLLSHQTGLPLHQLKECTLPQGTQVLYLGWLCAGKVQGLKKAAARFRVEAVCAVGMAPECDPAKLVGDNHCNGLPLFYLRGGYTPARVRGKYKMMMAMMKAILSKKTDPQSREALEAMKRGADWVSVPQLEPVLNWLRG